MTRKRCCGTGSVGPSSMWLRHSPRRRAPPAILPSERAHQMNVMLIFNELTSSSARGWLTDWLRLDGWWKLYTPKWSPESVREIHLPPPRCQQPAAWCGLNYASGGWGEGCDGPRERVRGETSLDKCCRMGRVCFVVIFFCCGAERMHMSFSYENEE